MIEKNVLSFTVQTKPKFFCFDKQDKKIVYLSPNKDLFLCETKIPG